MNRRTREDIGYGFGIGEGCSITNLTRIGKMIMKNR